MLPVGVLPFWAFVYMGAFRPVKAASSPTPTVRARVYATNCAPCHADGGEDGRVGPKLAGVEAALVPEQGRPHRLGRDGVAPTRGQPYGDPARPGGQHVAKFGGMPAFRARRSTTPRSRPS